MSSPAANEERAAPAAEAAPAAASVKRQKTNSDSEDADADAAQSNGPFLHDLPETTVASIAEYLPDLSRALFAIAISAPSSRWRERGWAGELSDVGKTILPETLKSPKKFDLQGLEWKVRQNLTDDDLGALLVVIDGARSLQKLAMGYTERIKGGGLEPLRGSSALRQIDIGNEHYLCEDVALPILGSIVGGEGSSLRHIQLPKKWRSGKSSNLQSFLERFDEVLFQRKIRCSDISCGNRCGMTRHGEDRCSFFEKGYLNKEGSGLQRLTCAKCLRHYCGCCKMYDGPPMYPGHCRFCDRYLCGMCAEVENCRDCKHSFCSLCKSDWGLETCSMCYDEDSEPRALCDSCHMQHIYTCSYCKRDLCNKCSQSVECINIGGWTIDCDKVACVDCRWEQTGAPKACSDCKDAYCGECMWAQYKKDGSYDGFGDCRGCMALLFPMLEEQSAKLAKENEELKSKLASLQA